MLRALPLLFALTACHQNTIERAPVETPAPAGERWGVETGAVQLEPGAWRTVELTVPHGAQRLEVVLGMEAGDVDLVVGRRGADAPSCEDVGWDGLLCRVEAPEPGLWTVDLLSQDGAEGVALTLSTEGFPSEPFLLGSLDADFAESVHFEVPDVLGELTAELTGSVPQFEEGAEAACSGETCSVLFPVSGPLDLVCEGGRELDLFWHPARSLLDDVVQSSATFEVDRAYDRIEARADGDSPVTLALDGVVRCSGAGRCRVDAPETGTWTVDVEGERKVAVGGSVTMLPAPPAQDGDDEPPVPLADQGDDRFSAMLVDGDLELDASLTPGDKDWFLLEIDGRVRVTTYGTTDTQGVAIDRTGSVLLRDDDSGPDQNFEIVLESGQAVWVEVSGFSPRTEGDYHLVIESL